MTTQREKRFPNGRYLFLDLDGQLYLKRYKKKRECVGINPSILSSVPLVLAKGITIKHLLELAISEPSLKVICSYVKEFYEESKDTPKYNVQGKIQFNWWPIDLDFFPENRFDGMSVDGIDEKNEAFAIDFLSTCEIAHLPVEIDTTQRIINTKELSNVEEIARVCSFPTLYNVLFGLFFELSFFGSPENRKTESEKLDAAINEAKNGETVDHEEVMALLEELKR